MALHFVGFCGDEYSRAVLVFGEPDFIHIGCLRAECADLYYPPDANLTKEEQANL